MAVAEIFIWGYSLGDPQWGTGAKPWYGKAKAGIFLTAETIEIWKSLHNLIPDS